MDTHHTSESYPYILEVHLLELRCMDTPYIGMLAIHTSEDGPYIGALIYGPSSNVWIRLYTPAFSFSFKYSAPQSNHLQNRKVLSNTDDGQSLR